MNVWHLKFWARKINSFDGKYFDVYHQSEEVEPWKAILPFYQTIEHVHLIDYEIICKIDVDNPLGI